MVNGINVKFLLFLSASIVSCVNLADVSIDKDLSYLNQIRADAQLIPFTLNHKLADAAQNHANYLTANNQHGHHEQAGLAHFTGEWVGHRALQAQYPNRLVSENVTSKTGDNSFYNPIDSLMSAIYHRFGFLDLSNNEIGIGHTKGTTNSYVYVMGNMSLSTLCVQPEFKGYGEYNFSICHKKTKRLDKKLVDKAKQRTQLANPKIILWPSKNAKNVSPVFYEESPDPLPHHSVSGYPISLQFNPAFYKSPPEVLSFTLRHAQGDKDLKSIRVMNHKNDPHKHFTEFQHALFVENRLDWDSPYIVSVTYKDTPSNKAHVLNWSFRTTGFKSRIVTIKHPNQTIKVKKKETVILYFPPKNAHDTQTALAYRDYQMDLKLNYIDQNTLNATITQPGKAEITFHNQTITLKTD